MKLYLRVKYGTINGLGSIVSRKCWIAWGDGDFFMGCHGTPGDYLEKELKYDYIR